jgi:hypothetical protein
VELLVVVAVIALMMGLVAPAVTSLGRSTALVTGGNLVTNLANFARQSAMAHNSMTALLILGAQGTPEDYRALTVMEYTGGRGGWTQIAPWQSLPPGIVIDFADTQNCTFCESPPPPFPFLTGPPVQKNPPVTYGGNQVGSSAYAARLYLPTGSLQNPQKPAQIRVVEGFAQGGNVIRTHPGEAGKSANYYDVAIVGATGTTKVSRP